MAKKIEQGPKPREEEPEQVLDQMVAKFRALLSDTAEDVRKAGPQDVQIGRAHIEAAYQKLVGPPKQLRSDAQKNITTAFKENRFITMAGYGMALALFAFGLFLLGFAAFGPTDAVGRIASLLGGSFAQVLLLIPLRFAISAKRNNFAIRILGYLLDRVDDPRLLADLIRRLIGEVAPGVPAGGGSDMGV